MAIGPGAGNGVICRMKPSREHQKQACAILRVQPPARQCAHTAPAVLLIAAPVLLAAGLFTSTSLAQGPEFTPVPGGTSATETARGGSGESCTKAADCQSGLKCMNQVCIDSKLGVEGDSCTKGADCNAHLRCMANRCMDPKAAPAAMPGAPPAPPATPPGAPQTVDINKVADDVAKKSMAQSFGGMAATLSLGYGGVTSGDGLKGVSYGFNGAIPMGRHVGISMLLAAGSGDSDSFGAYMAGLRFGNAVYFDALFGWARTRFSDKQIGTGTSYMGVPGAPVYGQDVHASFPGIGGLVGAHLNLNKTGTLRFAITPQLFIGHAMGGESPVILGLVGLSLRVPRIDE